MDQHLLSWILIAPLVGMAIALLLPRRSAAMTRLSCRMPAFVPLLLTTAIYLSAFRTEISAYQLVERIDWIRSTRAEYHIGVDRLSFALIWLTALLAFISVAANLSVAVAGRAYCALLFLLEFGLFGAFLSLDLCLLFAFIGLTLLAILLAIGFFGAERRAQTATRFAVASLAGSMLILISIVALRLDGGTFSIPTLLELARAGKLSGANLAGGGSLFGMPFTTWSLWCLILGFGIQFSATALLLMAPRRFALPLVALLGALGVAIFQLAQLWRVSP